MPAPTAAPMLDERIITIGSSLVPALYLNEQERLVCQLEGKVGWLPRLFGHRRQVWLTNQRIIHADKQLFSTDLVSLELDLVECLAIRGLFRIDRLIFGLMLLGLAVQLLIFNSLDMLNDPQRIGIGCLAGAWALYLLLTLRIQRLVALAGHSYSVISLIPRTRPDAFINAFSRTRDALLRDRATRDTSAC